MGPCSAGRINSSSNLTAISGHGLFVFGRNHHSRKMTVPLLYKFERSLMSQSFHPTGPTSRPFSSYCLGRSTSGTANSELGSECTAPGNGPGTMLPNRYRFLSKCCGHRGDKRFMCLFLKISSAIESTSS